MYCATGLLVFTCLTEITVGILGAGLVQSGTLPPDLLRTSKLVVAGLPSGAGIFDSEIKAAAQDIPERPLFLASFCLAGGVADSITKAMESKRLGCSAFLRLP